MFRKIYLSLILGGVLALTLLLLLFLEDASSQNEREVFTQLQLHVSEQSHLQSIYSLVANDVVTHEVYLPMVMRQYHKQVSWLLRGVTIDAYWHDAFSTQQVYDLVDYARDLGANSIALVVTWYQPDRTSSGPIAPTDRTVNDADLEAVIDYIHGQGIHVMLKPHVDPEEGWRGQFNPDDPETWFSNFTQFLLHYADLAERHNVELFCFGTEYVSLTHPSAGHTARWLDVIGAIEAVYHGELTYAAHMDNEYRDIPTEIWQRLDYAGVNIYYTLSTEQTPKVDDLLDAWYYYDDPRADCVIGPGARTYFDNLKNWHATHGKPVIFPEIGYRSIDFAATAPFRTGGPSHPCISDSVVLNEQGQANAYEAVFQAFDELDWMVGAYWWRLEAQAGGVALGGCRLPDYSFLCKVAAEVLRAWYAGPGSDLSCEIVPMPALPDVDLFEYQSDQTLRRIWQVRGTGIVTLSMDAAVYAPWDTSARSAKIGTFVPCVADRWEETTYYICQSQDWSGYSAVDVWVLADNTPPCATGGEFSIVLVDNASGEEETWQSTRWLETNGDWTRVRTVLEGGGQGDPWDHPRDFVIPPWGTVRNGSLDLTAVKGIGIKSFTGQTDCAQYPDFVIWVDNLKLSTMEKGLLDDFEGGSRNVWGGIWYDYDDSADGGTSTVIREIVTPGADGTGHAIRMRGRVTTNYPYGYIGIGTTLAVDGSPFDISEYKAVSFQVRGDRKRYRLRLESASVTDYNYHGYSFTAGSDSWRPINVPFSELRQESWGSQVPWTGTDIRNLSFQTVGQPHASVRLDIDDIVFYK
jgi:hypothetical protein